jgi:hypothetical protein
MVRAARYVYRMLRDPWWRSPRAKRSRDALLRCKDRHRGEDMVILATGPSLLHTDLSPFADMPKIGLNRLYMVSDRLDIQPDYHIVANDLLARQFADEFQGLPGLKMMPWTSRAHFAGNEDLVFLNYVDAIEFDPDILERVPVGATVTVAALHLAFWLGARTVYLVGVDHHYDLQAHEKGLAPHAVSLRQGPDQNHIHPDYFGTGTQWQVPDLAVSERAYASARKAYEAAGRSIFNATPKSRLDVFERML